VFFDSVRACVQKLVLNFFFNFLEILISIFSSSLQKYRSASSAALDASSSLLVAIFKRSSVRSRSSSTRTMRRFSAATSDSA
jgi:hypothetical protein